jgi:hypothetical protein
MKESSMNIPANTLWSALGSVALLVCGAAQGQTNSPPVPTANPQTLAFEVPVKLTRNAIDSVAVLCEVTNGYDNGHGLAHTLLATPGGEVDTIAKLSVLLSPDDVHHAYNWHCALVPMTSDQLMYFAGISLKRIPASTAVLASIRGSIQRTLVPR